jgi:hypothetical protein
MATANYSAVVGTVNGGVLTRAGNGQEGGMGWTGRRGGMGQRGWMGRRGGMAGLS